MIRISLSSLTLILLFIVCPATAQYQFDNKKAEKFYGKLDGYYLNYEYDKILKSEAEMLSTFEAKQDTVSATMYSFLAEAYLYGVNDMKKALTYYEKEYELRKSLGSDDLSAVAYNLGYLKDELGQYNETEDLYLEVLAIEADKYGLKSEQYFGTASALADHYMFVEHVDKGLDLCRQLRRQSVKSNSLEEAVVVKIMGDLYGIGGNYSRSERMLKDALNMMDELGLYASIEYVNTLTSLAGLYNRIGKIPEAEETYMDAKSILDRLQGDMSEYQLILNSNLALNYTSLGNYDVAEKMYLQNIEQDIEFYGEDSYPSGLDAANLANNYMYAGKLAKAESYFLKAGEVYKSIVGEESSDYAIVLQSLSSVYTRMGDLEKAKAMAMQAVNIFEKSSKDDRQIAFANYYLAETYFASDELEEAEKYHKVALELRKKALGVNHPDYAFSTTKLAILNWKKEDYKSALKYYKETFDNYFNQINVVFPILSEEEKTKFYYNKLKPAFEQYNTFIIETSAEDKSLLGEMYNNQLATKGLILYASGKIKASIINSGDSVLIAKYNTWIDQKETLAKLFSAGDMAVSVRNKKIDSLTTLSNNLEKEISQSSTAFASAFANKDVKWQDIQQKLKPGEAAVEIIRFRDFSTDSAGIFTDEVYYAALILTPQTTEAPEIVTMKNGKLMESRYLSNYRNAIKYKVDEDFSYKLFWRPIANKLQGISKVYFSPDGVFNQISIYTLRNPDSGKFTLDELDIQVITNTKDLLAVNQTSSSSNESVLFGYPNYNMGTLDDEKDPKDSGKSAEEAAKAAAENRGRGASRGGDRGGRGAEQGASVSRGGSTARGLRGNMLRYMRSDQLLALLPGTKKEVGLIDSLYKSKNTNVTTYLSNEALEESIKKVNSPKVLHIATHGFFLESQSDDTGAEAYMENPLLRSGLILAGANSYIATGKISNQINFAEDGILTAYEAMNLNLENTELVVLSACETGLGEVKNGEGVYGLQRAFTVAGADTMIMSMWTVDDDATQELMTIFYEEWLSGKTKQDAFNTAQKRLKDKWKSPYYWGAFVMVGQ
ncbi:MAG: CHAT domain-containing protein [Cyclobacteriaceae bacterium]|jgi:CHAT domain-containing protein